MNRDRCEGHWKQFSGKLKEHWGKLVHDAPGVQAGMHEQLVGRIQEQRGLSKEEDARQLREFLHRNRDWYPSSH